MTPIGWYEDPTVPAPPDRCVLCGVDRLTHNDVDCAKWVPEADICGVCDGMGILGDVRRSDYDGRRCGTCGGQGHVESHYQAGEPA